MRLYEGKLWYSLVDLSSQVTVSSETIRYYLKTKKLPIGLPSHRAGGVRLHWSEEEFKQLKKALKELIA